MDRESSWTLMNSSKSSTEMSTMSERASHFSIREAANEDVAQLVFAIADTLGGAPLQAAVFRRRGGVRAGEAVIGVNEGGPCAGEK